MTRADLRTLILGWLDDPNGTYFTSTLVNTWLNLAQRRVQLELIRAGQAWYERAVETTLVVDQVDYMLPSDFVVEHRIEVVVSGTGTGENRQQLKQITTNQQDLVSLAPGNPAAYFMKKDRFTISPAPSAQLVMRMYYSPRVADMTSDLDSPDVPEQYMEYVALRAAFDGYIKDDRMPEVIVTKIKEVQDELKKSAQQRTQDSPRMIVMTQDIDFGGGYA